MAKGTCRWCEREADLNPHGFKTVAGFGSAA